VSQTTKARSPSEDDLEVSPPLGDSRFMLEPTNATYVEEWESSTKGMRYAVPTAVGAQGGKATEAWLAMARKNRKGEPLTRKKPQWTGEERSPLSLLPTSDDSTPLSAQSRPTSRGCHPVATGRGIALLANNWKESVASRLVASLNGGP